MDSPLLLRVEPADYARLVARRRRAVILPFILCSAVAATIVVVEYRLMMIAFVAMFPAFIAVLDAMMVARAAAALGSAEVRCDGEWLTLNPTTRFRVDTIALVRVQPDAVTVVEKFSPRKQRGHLLAVDDMSQVPLVAKLTSLGRKVKVEQSTIALLKAFVWTLADYALGTVAAMLLLAGIGFTIQGWVDGLVHGPLPFWEALACFGGAAISVMILVVASLRPAKRRRRR